MPPRPMTRDYVLLEPSDQIRDFGSAGQGVMKLEDASRAAPVQQHGTCRGLNLVFNGWTGNDGNVTLNLSRSANAPVSLRLVREGTLNWPGIGLARVIS